VTTPSPTTYDALQKRKNELIRKALEGSIFVAPDGNTLPTAMTTGASGDLLSLPDGFVDVGWVDSKQGATWARKPTVADVDSWGSLEPTRTDFTADDRSLQFTAQETKAITLELAEGVDMSTVVPDATTGEVQFAVPIRPETRYYRAFGLFVDGDGSNAIYVGRLMPRAVVTAVGDEVWSQDTDAVVRPLTLSARTDSTVGYAMRHFFGGPGWQAILSEMGFATS
jgi:hypothetical protein